MQLAKRIESTFFLIVLLGAFFNFSDSFAGYEPTPLVGDFTYQGEMRPIRKIEVEAVHTISKNGKARLVELKDRSFKCQHVNRGTYRCSQASDLALVEDWARRRIENQMLVKRVSFEKASGVENLVDNEDYKSWRIQGEVDTAVGQYSEYLWSWTPTLSKVTVADEDQPDLPRLYFNFETESQLNQQTVVHKTLDRNRFESHVIQMVFAKENESN